MLHFVTVSKITNAPYKQSWCHTPPSPSIPHAAFAVPSWIHKGFCWPQTTCCGCGIWSWQSRLCGGGTILPLLSQAFALGLVLLLLSDQGVPPSTATAQKYQYNAKAAVCSASTTAQKLLRCIMPLWYNKGIPAELLANFFGTSFWQTIPPVSFLAGSSSIALLLLVGIQQLNR